MRTCVVCVVLVCSMLVLLCAVMWDWGFGLVLLLTCVRCALCFVLRVVMVVVLCASCFVRLLRAWVFRA